MKLFTTILAISLGLWICSTAAAQSQDLRNPDQAAPPPVYKQDLRNPDQVAPATVPWSDPIPDSGVGLSTLLVVLLSVGGAVALAGAGYATLRVAHSHHGHAAA